MTVVQNDPINLVHAHVPYSLASRLIRRNSPHFAMRFCLFAKPTRFPEIEVLSVTRRAVHYMLPVLILLNVLEPRGSGREVLKNLGSWAASPFWVGVGGLHSLLVLTL